MSVTKRIRFEVLRRDNYTCRYCRSTDNALTVDHVTPVALGGSDDPTNLVAACRDCNAGKASAAPDSVTVHDVAQDALRWAAAIQEAARQRRAQMEPIREAQAAFADYWNGFRGQHPTPATWWQSVETWHSAGLDVQEMFDCVDIAMVNPKVTGADVWRYACGVAWTKIRNLNEAAQALVDTEAC